MAYITLVRSNLALNLFVSLGLLILFSISVEAQIRRTTDGVTPPGMAPGAPAGSYPLSEAENINLYNGQVSYTLPVTQQGRGGANISLPIRITPRPWNVKYQFLDYPQPWPIPGQYQHVFNAEPDWWNETAARAVLPGGRMIGRYVAEDAQDCYSNGTFYFMRTNTRLTFTAPDGTEYNLIDKEHGGNPRIDTCNFLVSGYRGSVFVTADGTSATFYSQFNGNPYAYADLVSTADPQWITSSTTFYPSGYLMLKDGTRYDISDGYVTRMRDRNGNEIRYEPIINIGIVGWTITDSLNRQIIINYDVNDGPPYGVVDRITIKGFGGADRYIRISYNFPSGYLRTTQPTDPTTPWTLQQLFPELDSIGPAGGPSKVSTIWLPDGRTYKFRYNVYGELARVELPTGGAIEYDYSGGELNGTSSGVIGDYLAPRYPVPPGSFPPLIAIYRRLVERRVYSGLSISTLVGKTTYSKPEIVDPGLPTHSSNLLVEQWDPNSGACLARSRHYFQRSARNSLLKLDGAGAEDIGEAKEKRTDALDTSPSMSELRRVEQVWGNNTYVPNDGYPIPFDPHIDETKTTLTDANLVSKQTFSYGQYNNQSDGYEYDFGVGAPGALVRRTHTDYVTVNNGVNYATNDTIHIRNLPSQQQIFDAGGIKRAETIYEYDNYNQSNPDVFHAALANCANISKHDGAFSTAYFTRGNITKTTRSLLNNSGGVTGSINSHAQYDIAGNVIKTIDPRSTANPLNIIATTVDFSDNFGAPDDPTVRADEDPANNAPGELGTQKSYAFPFKVINALGHKAYTKYDYYLGRPVLSEDSNNVKSSIHFNDALDRPTKGVRAIGTAAESQTVFVYNDSDSPVNGNPPRSITTINDKDALAESDNGNGLKSLTLYDGLGRTWRGASYEGNTGGGNTWLITETQFDALGRTRMVSNPFRLTAPDGASGSLEWMTTEYDALGRMKLVTTHDGAFVTTTYSGNSVTVEDQHDPDDPDPAKRVGRKRRSETDAIGRLTKVTEDPSTGGLNYDTTYFYDALGNLLKVAQGSQRRWFAYDSMSRLIRARNPEQATFNFTFNPPQSTVTVTAGGESNSDWSMAYVYDPNGNLLKKKSVTGPSGSPTEIETSYLYDSLNRNTQTAYSSYPNGSFYVDRFYDGATNGKGRFWYDIAYNYRWEKPTDNLAYHHNKVISYDPLGRPLNQQQNFIVLEGGSWQYKPFSLSRTYDLAGNVKTQTYPSNRTVNYGYDTAGRPNSFTGNLGGGAALNYATDIQYNAYGLMKRETYGTQTPLYHNLHYNNRLQMVDFRVGDSSTDEWNYSRGAIARLYGRAAVDGWAMFANCKDNNGNALRQLHYAPLAGGGDVITQRDDYIYDSLNRIKSVTENQRNQSGQWTPSPVFTQAFLYDRWGNRTIDMAATTSGIPGVTRKNFVVDTATNRMTSVDGCTMTYDAAGNQTYDCVGTHYYDSENRMTKAVQGGSNNYYFYDANGKRVRRILNGSETWNGQETWFVYGFDGELVAEYTYNQVTPPLPGAPQKEYGYRGGKMLVVWDGSQAGDDALKWLVTDQLGSTRWEINKSGSLAGTRRHDYLPFGEELVASTGAQRTGVGYEPPASNVKVRFDGYERDSETGLDFAQARYFSSVQGRFTSPDPYMPSADVKEPQSWNRYSFAINNPLRYVDPTGLDYEHLQGRQKELIDEWAKRQNEANKTKYTAQQLYDGLSESRRTTYESVTHGLMNTQLVDKEGKSLGTALDLVKSVETIAGDEKGKGSDEKFRVYATLNDNATSILKEARGVKTGENGIYHGEYKLSFRQERKDGKMGLEAGFQVSATRDGRRGDLDVDYRFGISHLGAGNSDVRAKGNYQKHIDRWPGLPNWWDKKPGKK